MGEGRDDPERTSDEPIEDLDLDAEASEITERVTGGARRVITPS